MSSKTIFEFVNTRPVLALLLTTCVVYLKSIFNGYALDDELYALSPSLSELSWDQFSKIFSSATFYDKGDMGYDYRPLALSSFFIEYLVFGKHVLISHVLNLGIYAVVLIQFYKILIKLGMSRETVLVTMLLFALHPIHTEVVCNLKCRDELLAFVFALLSFHFAISYFQKPKISYLLFVFLFFLISFFSKQTTTVFLAAIPVSLALCFGFDKKKTLTIFLILLLSVITFVLIRKQIILVNTRQFLYYENPFPMGHDFSLRISTGFSVAFRYLKLLVVPYPLAYYYGYKFVNVSYFNDVAVILSILIHVMLIVILIRNWRNNKQLAFGICFYLVNIFVISFFLRIVPGLMGERFLFAASLGYCVLLSVLFQKLRTGLKTRSNLSFKLVVTGVLVFYAVLTFNRSKVWKDKETLCSHDMKTLENSAKANLLYGSLLSDQALREKNKDKLEKAIYHLQKTTSIVPDYALAWEHLGVLHYFNGDLKTAFFCLNKAILKDSLSGKAYFDKGVIYESIRYFSMSEKFYRLSIKKDSAYIPCYLKLMGLLERQSQPDKALLVGRVGATHEKKSDLVYSEMIRIALTNHDTLSAIGFSEKAIVVNPKNETRIQTLENYFRAHGNNAKANFYREILTDGQH